MCSTVILLNDLGGVPVHVCASHISYQAYLHLCLSVLCEDMKWALLVRVLTLV